MTTPIKVDVSSLLGTAGQRKHFNALVNMQPVHRGDDEFTFQGAVEVDVVVESLKRGLLLVEGDVSGMVRLVCNRCLMEFSHAVGAPLSETFCVPMRMKEDEECYVIEGHEMDLGPAVEQAFLLALPMKILHADDCRGLCPICGVNLNEEPHHKHEAEANPQFEALGRLLGGEWTAREEEEEEGDKKKGKRGD